MSLLKKSFITTILSLSSFGAFSLISPSSTHAQATDPICPSNPGAAGLANKEAFGSSGTFNGFCRGTPSVYGISVYKMGFCTSNPLSGGAGVKADYSSCQMTFTSSSSSGTPASFAAGSSFPLPASGALFPAVGTYKFAVIELAPSFDIADSFGPFGDGLTYYSTTSPVTSAGGSPASTTSGAAATFTDNLTSFDPGTSCDASDTVSISGASLTGALLNSSDELIADSSSAKTCSGVSKLLGVAELATPVEISSSTKGLTATFTVTDNGSSVMCDGQGPMGCDNILFASGPFNVSFLVIE